MIRRFKSLYLIVFYFGFNSLAGLVNFYTCIIAKSSSRVKTHARSTQHVTYNKKHPQLRGVLNDIPHAMCQNYSAGVSSDGASTTEASSTAGVSSAAGAGASAFGASFLGRVKAFTFEASISFLVIKRF